MQHVIQRIYARRMLTALCVAFVAAWLLCGTALADEIELRGTDLASEVEYGDNDREDLNDYNTTYVIKGDGTEHKSGNYFYVPENSSSQESRNWACASSTARHAG